MIDTVLNNFPQITPGKRLDDNAAIYNHEMKNFMPVIQGLMLQKSMDSKSHRLPQIPVKLQSDHKTWYHGTSAIEGVRPKGGKIPDKTLRELHRKSPVINLAVKARIDETIKFLKVSKNESDEGFFIAPEDSEKKVTPSDKKVISEIEKFVLNCGDLTIEEKYMSGWGPKAEHTIKDFMNEYLWNLLILDAAPIYKQNDLSGEFRGFLVIDGANILRVKEPYKTKVRGIKDGVYVEVIDDQLKNVFKHDQICYCYLNKRPELKYAGYGYSPIEMSIDAVLGYIFGMDYNMGAFSRWKVPSGFLTVQADTIDQETMDSIARYWRSAMTGPDGQWSMPILPSTKDGAIDFKKIRDSNREMEYKEWMDRLFMHILAIYGVSAEEVGFELSSGQKGVFDDTKHKIGSSKDRFRNLLGHLGDTMTKLIHSREEWKDWEIRFRGLDLPDKKNESEILDKELSTYRTMNDVLKEKGMPELKGYPVKVGEKTIEAGEIPAPFKQEWQNIIAMANAGQEQEGMEGGGPEEGQEISGVEGQGEEDTDDQPESSSEVDSDDEKGGESPEGEPAGEGGSPDIGKAQKAFKDFFII